jgi:hypothetical protein
VNSLFRSPGLAVRRCLWVAAAAFFVKVAEPVVGFVKEGQLGLPRASLYGSGHRWRVKTQDLGSLGRVPGRWVIVDVFIPSFEAGVFFDSSQSHWAMGLLQISVVFVVDDDGCRRWGCRAASASTRPRGLIVIFAFLGSFVQFGRCSGMYPFHTFLYVYILLCGPYLVIQICT